MPINYIHLRAFYTVASQGSFSRAAAVLHSSQPTLSEHVKTLQERYDVKLFERRGRGIELTDLGQALFAVSQRLFALEAEAEQLLEATRSLASGQLRVGADAPYHIVQLLAGFTGRYPGVRLSIQFGNSEQLIDALLQRRCDIAVLPKVPDDGRFYSLRLHPDHLVVFVSRAHAWSTRRSIRLQELTEQRLILREPGSATRATFERALAEQQIKLTDTLEIGSREGVREAVAAGLGVGVVSEKELGHDNRLHALQVRDAKLETIEYAACLAERRPLRVVRAFFEMVDSG